MGHSISTNDEFLDNVGKVQLIPLPRKKSKLIVEGLELVLNTVSSEQCSSCSFDSFPFNINKKSRTRQICHYEMQHPRWKGVVMCTNHGICLCTNIVKARGISVPKLYKLDRTAVTEYSWTCSMDASCWMKFHEFYEPWQINVSEKIKSRCPVCTSDLYQKKYTALGIVVHSND